MSAPTWRKSTCSALNDGKRIGAEAYVAEFRRIIAMIEQFPFAARERAEFSPPVRVQRFGAHQIIYPLHRDTVAITRMAHGRSDWVSQPV